MAIDYVTTANTFQQWLIATQNLITTANNLTDNIGGIFYANTNLIVGNTLNVVGDTTISGNLIVSGNITLDALGFDDLLVNGSAEIANTLSVAGNTTVTLNQTIGGTLDVTGNATFVNANVTNILTANIANVTSLVGVANAAIYTRIETAEASSLAFAIALG
jgi:hypothetical protein